MVERHKMQIVTPTLEHLAGLIVESKGWYDEMGFDEFGNGWDLDRVIEWWRMVITQPIYEAVIAIEGLRIIGAFVCFYKDKHFWHTGPLHACEMVNHTASDLVMTRRGKAMIGMFGAMVAKLKKRKTDYLFIGYDPRPEFKAYGEYLKRKGFIDTSHVLMAKVGDL